MTHQEPAPAAQNTPPAGSPGNPEIPGGPTATGSHLASAPVPGGPVPNGPVPSMTVRELKQRLDAEQPLILLDVREPFERDIADLPDHGQRRIPMSELPTRIDEIESRGPVVVYCRTGNRSEWAAQQLRRRGLDGVFNLEGGVMAWRDEIDPSLEAY